MAYVFHESPLKKDIVGPQQLMHLPTIKLCANDMCICVCAASYATAAVYMHICDLPDTPLPSENPVNPDLAYCRPSGQCAPVVWVHVIPRDGAMLSVSEVLVVATTYGCAVVVVDRNY